MYPYFLLLLHTDNWEEVKNQPVGTPLTVTAGMHLTFCFCPKTSFTLLFSQDLPHSFKALYICKLYLTPSQGERFQDVRDRVGQMEFKKKW